MKRLLALFGRKPNGDALSMREEWDQLIKKTIARYASGNISAQRERVLLPHEQEQEHQIARGIARRWRERPAPTRQHRE